MFFQPHELGYSAIVFAKVLEDSLSGNQAPWKFPRGEREGSEDVRRHKKRTVTDTVTAVAKDFVTVRSSQTEGRRKARQFPSQGSSWIQQQQHHHHCCCISPRFKLAMEVPLQVLRCPERSPQPLDTRFLRCPNTRCSAVFVLCCSFSTLHPGKLCVPATRLPMVGRVLAQEAANEGFLKRNLPTKASLDSQTCTRWNAWALWNQREPKEVELTRCHYSDLSEVIFGTSWMPYALKISPAISCCLADASAS